MKFYEQYKLRGQQEYVMVTDSRDLYGGKFELIQKLNNRNINFSRVPWTLPLERPPVDTEKFWKISESTPSGSWTRQKIIRQRVSGSSWQPCMGMPSNSEP